METWLLLSNCQTFGLANSLNLLNPKFHIEAVDVYAFQHGIEKYRATLPEYFRVIIHPYFQTMDFDFTAARNLDIVPSIEFDAYHPDVCYAFSESGGPLDGPMSAYHSMIVLAAYEAGLSAEATRKLFRRDVFERCGFLTRWEEERTDLINNFAQHGLDISSAFRNWSRGDSFMYSVNHPKIHCVYDIARAFMKRLGVQTFEGGIVPMDNLLKGPCYPVYPEIAETFGARGSYLFKMHNDYRLISLETFIDLSFASYSRFPVGTLHIEKSVRGRYAQVKAVITEAVG